MTTNISSPDFWIEQWRAASANSPMAGNRGYASRRVWDGMAASYGSARVRDSRRQEADDLIATLESRGLFREEMRVLDVGCGTGRMAIPFAQHGAQVVALDFSTGMLGRMREATPQELSNSIETVQADWADLDLGERGWERHFDLAFAAMTPAIRTPEAFLKLHHASRHGCYFRGWAGRREDPVLAGLWQHLKGEPMPPMTPWDITLAFNLLYAMGYSPAIEFQEISWETQEPIDEVATFFANFFGDQQDLSTEHLRGQVHDYLETIAQNGLVVRQTKGRTGAMMWEVE